MKLNKSGSVPLFPSCHTRGKENCNLKPPLLNFNLTLKKLDKSQMTLWGIICAEKLTAVVQLNYILIILPIIEPSSVLKRQGVIVKRRKEARIIFSKLFVPNEEGGLDLPGLYGL